MSLTAQVTLYGWTRSRRLQYLAGTIAILFALLTLLRIVFLLKFAGHDLRTDVDTAVILKGLSIGLRFDLRLAILIALPVVVPALIPRWNLATSTALRWITRAYLTAAVLVVLLIYVLDFGHYAYLGIRLNATVLRFLEDAQISAHMVWQSYPVVWITLGWLATTFVTVLALIALERRTLHRPPRSITRGSAALGVAAVLMATCFALLGRVTGINPENPTPLRWNDAFFSGNASVAALGLNPVLFLYDTRKLPTRPYDEAIVRQHYPVVSRYLGVDVPNSEKLDFARAVGPQPHRLEFERMPNVIFVMLESLGASRLGVHGNPLDPTPNLDALARNGWWFRHFYVPATGTAKTVWASISGVPDVTRGTTATRNPLITHQRTVINAFDGHTKLYMIGGNAGWANISALIRRSIDGVRLYEEQHWSSPNIDVWGISDLNLFKESDRILRSLPRNEPFFAFIQTASNHRPFTIPRDNDDFVVKRLPAEEVQKYGFVSVEQFNAVRLLDYNIGRLLEIAREGGYFDNTIFVFFGDHNDRITRLPHMPPAFEQLNLESVHVPFILYSPRYLESRVFEQAVTLTDVLPTVAGLLGLSYRNTALGRDIQMPAPEGERAVPVILLDSAYPQYGAVTRKFLVRMHHDGSNASLHDLLSDSPTENVAQQHPDEFRRLEELARALHETARYMLYSNSVDSLNR